MLDVVIMLNANVDCCLTGAYAKLFVVIFLVVFRLVVVTSSIIYCTKVRTKIDFYLNAFIYFFKSVFCFDCLFFCLVAVITLKFVFVLMDWVIGFSILSFIYDDLTAAVRSIE